MSELDWKDKKVIVTGGTGFLGAHLVERLIDLGSNLTVIDQSQDLKSYFFIKNFEKSTNLIICDINDDKRIFNIIKNYVPEIIFHLAAQTIVPEAYSNPFETLNTNVRGTFNILEGLRLFGDCKAIVVASTDKAYGFSENLPYQETDKLEGKFPYDVSKSCADLISRMYFHSYNLPVVVTRIVNIFGPGDLHFSRIIPGIMEAVIMDKPLEIRSNGKMIREYIYVKDVVEGYIQLAENIKKTRGEAFNLGSNVKLSVLEVIDKISSILKKDVKYSISNTAKGEIPNQHLSYKKIMNYINWKPSYSFEMGVLETYKWYNDIYFK